MKVQFVAGFGPLVRDRQASLAFYRDTLGLPLQGDEYVSCDDLEGVKHFGQWTLEDAAESIFGKREWPADLPVPLSTSNSMSTARNPSTKRPGSLQAAGYPVLVGPKKEEWGQTVLRLQGPEGLLISITYTPWLH